MENTCGWIAQTESLPARDRLTGLQKADWLVIGAGITGLCAAHNLAEMHPEARIVIVDRQRAAQGASARNSGFVVAHEHPAASELMGNAGFADFEVDTAISRAASDEVRERIAPIWEHADSACLNPPSYGLDPGAMLRYGAKIAEIFYS